MLQATQKFARALLAPKPLPNMFLPVAGVRVYDPPSSKKEFEEPTRKKLRILEKVPQYPPTLRPFKMQKRLKYMRGPELVHNTFVYKQFGIIALTGGRLKHGHNEMIRVTLARKLDFNKCFAIWRVDPPWQPVTKKGQGHRMGGGKGSIDCYVTPIKAGRVIVEVAGNVEFFEIERVLKEVAHKLPFDAIAVSQEMLDERAKEEREKEEKNLHPWTWKYMVQNNMLGCRSWTKPVDAFWFNKYQ